MRERLEIGRQLESWSLSRFLEKRRDNRFFENKMELTWGETQIDNVGNGRNKDRSTYFQKPGGDRIRVRLLVRTVEKILDISDSDAGLKDEKLEGSVGGEGECGDEVEALLVGETWSLEILSVKKLAKLSAREEPGVEVGNGDEDLRRSRLLTVFHRRFGLSETEETKLEKYCFLEVRINLCTYACVSSV